MTSPPQYVTYSGLTEPSVAEEEEEKAAATAAQQSQTSEKHNPPSPRALHSHRLQSPPKTMAARFLSKRSPSSVSHSTCYTDHFPDTQTQARTHTHKYTQTRSTAAMYGLQRWGGGREGRNHQVENYRESGGERKKANEGENANTQRSSSFISLI